MAFWQSLKQSGNAVNQFFLREVSFSPSLVAARWLVGSGCRGILCGRRAGARTHGGVRLRLDWQVSRRQAITGEGHRTEYSEDRIILHFHATQCMSREPRTSVPNARRIDVNYSDDTRKSLLSLVAAAGSPFVEKRRPN